MARKKENKTMAKYTVRIGGSFWGKSQLWHPEHSCDTIADGRRIAEEYGRTADWGSIVRTSDGREVALHRRRDPQGNGTRWYKATI